MPLQAFLLIVVAAIAHSTWNILAKRAAHFKHLIWFSSAIEAALFLPIAAWILSTSWRAFGWKAGGFLLVTGLLHLLYSESLLRGYRVSDLSVVYPLARGSGPLLSYVGAILVLHESTSTLSAAGAALVTFGILLSSGRVSGLGHGVRHSGVFWGLATGFIIAFYTLTDAYSVKVLLISPFLVEYAGNLFRTLALSGGVWRRRVSSAHEFSRYWKEALGIAILTPTGYVLALFAMKLAPVSHVAPVREMSMMIGAYFGVKFLGEGHAGRRMVGSALIATGVAALALG